MKDTLILFAGVLFYLFAGAVEISLAVEHYKEGKYFRFGFNIMLAFCMCVCIQKLSIYI